MEKLFWKDPYLTETKCKITEQKGDIIKLDRTIIFPFSGGQQSDSGTIEGFEVLEARKEDKEIFYRIQENHGLKAGDYVVVKIDWQKRYRLMRLHFAAELVLELVYQNFGKPQKIGANINEDKARVDFFWKGNISETFPLIMKEINSMVNKNLEIISSFSDEENEIRYWEIEGFAKVPCGGTHLKRTGEIGTIKLKRNNLGKDKERIEIYLCDS
ncbi:MAG: serine-tRNA(Ala) deacylase AlaX [Firmicutes bacterium]|nr:serine-tRNA(Ala) deacylase AlaX [Bacillota bacterium]